MSKSLGRGLHSGHLAAPEKLAKGFVLRIYIPITAIIVLFFFAIKKLHSCVLHLLVNLGHHPYGVNGDMSQIKLGMELLMVNWS